MWNGPWQGLFAESSAADGAVICPAYERGQMTAGHDGFRETNRPINFARSEAPCVRRSDWHRDLAPDGSSAFEHLASFPVLVHRKAG